MPTPKQPPIALLYNGIWSQYAVATSTKYRRHMHLVHAHDLERIRLDTYRAVIIPFQSNHQIIQAHVDRLRNFLAAGGRVAVFGNTTDWIGATWVDRAVDNYWWVDHPDDPPVAWTDFDHPLFTGLSPRHVGWHHHGVYIDIPEGARVLQRSRDGEVVTWETDVHGGHLLAATSDPIVEHGIQQIRHLDHFVDRLVAWLGGGHPDPQPMTVEPAQFEQAVA